MAKAKKKKSKYDITVKLPREMDFNEALKTIAAAKPKKKK